MNRLFGILAAFLALLAVPASAQSAFGYNASFEFWISTPVRYSYTQVGSSFEGPKLLKGEVFRVLLIDAAPTEGLSNPEELPFTIDRAGQIVPKPETGATEAHWGTIESRGAFALVGDTPGIPGTPGANDIASFSASAPFLLPENKVFHMYLVALDTRQYEDDTTCAGEPVRVSRYAARYCPGVGVGFPGIIDLGPRFYVGFTTNPSYGTALRWLGVESVDGVFVDSWVEASPIVALTVTETNESGEPVEKTLTGVELEAYLSPTISAMEMTDGELTFSASSPDVMFYTLYTKSALEEQEWKRFEDVLQEKGLDRGAQSRYSRCRIKEMGSLKIPLAQGDPARFYKFVGEQ